MPVSAVTMEYKYHAKDDKAAAIIDGLCRTAASYCREVEFSALDATRADPSFLKRAIETAVNAGATYVTLCDDEGGSLDTETGKLVAAVAEYCNVPIFVKVSNRLGMATACAAAPSLDERTLSYGHGSPPLCICRCCNQSGRSRR